jgi:phosphosulfolactate phosphohydrolase-like enzyme
MTTEEVQARIAEIVKSANDPEMAHTLEDTLYAEFIAAVASGAVRGKAAQHMAALILTTRDIEFPRWCA